MRALSDREQRLVAAALLLALLTLVWTVVAAPLLSAASNLANRREQAQKELDRDTRLLATAPRVRAAYAIARANSAQIAISDPRPALVARAFFGEAMKASGETVTEASLTDDPSSEGRIHLTAELLGSQSAIVHLIRRLEDGPPAARITDLVILSPDEGPQEADGVLRARLGVEYLNAPPR